VINVVQKLVLRNEVVKVRGRVKVITIKKEDFDKILKLTKLRILDKEYEALMPPLDDLQKNTIDVNGLSALIQQFMSIEVTNSGNTSQTSQAEMVLTTSGGNITLSYTNNINMNSQGVTVFIQIFQESGNYTFQYYYIAFDTTDSSYTTSQIELYASAISYNGTVTFYTDVVRIAYANMSFTKTSDSYLFIVWLIEFQNIPPYLLPFTPTLQSNTVTALKVPGNCTVYFNNGSCSFGCGGDCPSRGLNGFVIYTQNNSIILEFPFTVPLGTGVSNVEVMLCTVAPYNNIPTISGSISATLTPPVSGATFYVAIATITVTYVGS
jgi:hypothetical protein